MEPGKHRSNKTSVVPLIPPYLPFKIRSYRFGEGFSDEMRDPVMPKGANLFYQYSDDPTILCPVEMLTTVLSPVAASTMPLRTSYRDFVGL